MKFPDRWEELKPDEMVVPITEFMMADVATYWLMLLYVEYTLESYDEKSGMFPEPPTLKSGGCYFGQLVAATQNAY